MGLTPPFSDYEVGNDCAVCHASLFESITPKYVIAHFYDVELCPGSDVGPPNGNYILTQDVNPCVWKWVDCYIAIAWTLGNGWSALQVHQRARPSFYSLEMFNCIDWFENQTVCGVDFAACHNGVGWIEWGTGIGPPSGYRSGERGDDCDTCQDVIFNGSTPKYVRACIVDIVKCNPLFPPPPNGSYLLTGSSGGPGVYDFYGTSNGITIRWGLFADHSYVQVSQIYLSTVYSWFYATHDILCVTTFTNQLNCILDVALGHQGTVKLMW